MNTLMKHISIVSTLGLMALGTATYASAQKCRIQHGPTPREASRRRLEVQPKSS